MMKTLRIATRNSPLAMWQANFVAEQLQQFYPKLEVDIIGMTTKGDQLLDSPLSKIGGKGLFVKELETAILEQRADIAVHSMKDVGVYFPEGLGLACIMARHNPYDVMVSNHYQRLDDLPEKSVVGTSSLRRVCQLSKHYPGLVFRDLRGNVNTRLAKLDAGEFDAIILATAGLERLGLTERIAEVISPDIVLPAIAQGSLGIEYRLADTATGELLSVLADQENTARATAERAVNERLNGSCQMPIAAYCTQQGTNLYLRALIGSPDGRVMLYAQQSGEISSAATLGLQVAEALLAQGAQSILDSLS